MGLRDGVAEGQETILQQGFNVGYKESAELSAKMALLRGKLRCVRLANENCILSSVIIQFIHNLNAAGIKFGSFMTFAQLECYKI